MKTTHHELLTLSEIFEDDSKDRNGEIKFRKFIIPDYQRSYSWEEGHRADLIEDIIQAQKSSYRHFTGTIVLSQSAEDKDVFEIVDGQQRLTTLILLMLSMVRVVRGSETPKAINDGELKEIESRYIVSGADSGNSEYRLKLNHMQRDLFRDLINETHSLSEIKTRTKFDLNLIDAINQFKEFLEKVLKEEGAKGIETLYKVVTEKLGFLVYVPDKSSETGLMFEIINNRGKSLSNLEKVKNYLIYFSDRNDCGDLKDTIRERWPEILRCLSDAKMASNWDEDDFLRVCWLVFSDPIKKNSHHVYDELKKKYPPDDGNHWEVLQEFVEFLAKAADTYKKMFQQNQGKKSEVEKKLELISLHTAYVSIMPLVIAVDIKSENDKDKEELLDILEKLNFRYYNTWISGRADSGQGELFHLAYNFYNEKKDQSESQSELKTSLISFIDNNADDYTFVKHLTLDKDEAGDYGKWREIRFFLANYEKSLCKEVDQKFDLNAAFAPIDQEHHNSSFDLEHIWATKEYEVINDKDAPDINKRRLGNFLLLEQGVNRRVGDDRVEVKINAGYFKGDKGDVIAKTEMARELPEMYVSSKGEWDDKYERKVKNYWHGLYGSFFDKREQEMINFALKRWGVDGVKKPVERVEINSSMEENGRKLNENFRCYPERNRENDNEQTG